MFQGLRLAFVTVTEYDGYFVNYLRIVVKSELFLFSTQCLIGSAE